MKKKFKHKKTGDRAGYHCSSNHCAGWRSQTKVKQCSRGDQHCTVGKK